MATSFLKTDELVFYESFNRGGSSTIANDAQIGGLAPVPKDDNYAASKAYVDSMAANVSPHEGVDYVSLSTDLAALRDNENLYFSNGASRTATRDTQAGGDEATMLRFSSEVGSQIIDVLRPSHSSTTGEWSPATFSGEFVLSGATTQNSSLTIAGSRYVGEAVSLFDVKAHNDGLDALATPIAQETAVAYVSSGASRFTVGSEWTSDEQGFGAPATLFKVTAVETVDESGVDLLKVTFARIGGEAIPIAAPIHPIVGVDGGRAPLMRPVERGSRTPNIFYGTGVGTLTEATYEYSALRASTALQEQMRYRLLLTNWGGNAADDITNASQEGTDNVLNGVWELQYDAATGIQFRRPSDWGGAGESGAWYDAPTNPTAEGMHLYQETALTLEWNRKTSSTDSTFTFDSAAGSADGSSSTALTGLGAVGTPMQIISGSSTIDVTIGTATDTTFTISAADDKKLVDAGLADGPLEATIEAFYIATPDAAGVHTVFINGFAETFSFEPTAATAELPAGKAEPEQGVPLRDAYLGCGAYVVVCSGIGGPPLNRGRATAWVMNNGDSATSASMHVLIGVNKQRCFIFKSSNLDFDTIDGQTLALDEQGRLQLAPAAVTPQKLAPSFVSWLDGKIGAGGIAAGAGGGAIAAAGASSESGRNKLQCSDLAEYAFFECEASGPSINVDTVIVEALRSNGADVVGVVVEVGTNESIGSDQSPIGAGVLSTAGGASSGIISGANGLEIKEGRYGYSTPTPPGSMEIGWSNHAYVPTNVPHQDYFVPDETLTVASLEGAHNTLRLKDAQGNDKQFLAGKVYRILVRHAGVSIVADESSGIVAALFGQDGRMYAKELIVQGDIRAEQLELTSDVRRKDNIRVQDGAACLDALSSVDSLTYELASRGPGRRYRGVSAQAVQQAMPELVSQGENGELSVDYAGLTSALCGAMGTLRSRVEALELDNTFGSDSE